MHRSFYGYKSLYRLGRPVRNTCNPNWSVRPRVRVFPVTFTDGSFPLVAPTGPVAFWGGSLAVKSGLCRCKWSTSWRLGTIDAFWSPVAFPPGTACLLCRPSTVYPQFIVICFRLFLSGSIFNGRPAGTCVGCRRSVRDSLITSCLLPTCFVLPWRSLVL